MICLDSRPVELPYLIRRQKLAVLDALQFGHKLMTYRSRAQLADFLDREILPGVKLILGAAGLTRVILFYYDPLDPEVIIERLLPGGELKAYRQPTCWSRLYNLLDTGKLTEETGQPIFGHGQPLGDERCPGTL